MRCPGILRSILINILGDFPERGVGFWNLGGTFAGSRTILWAVRFCGEPDDTADGGDWAGRYTLGGLGQRCGERIAQSYAAGLPSRFAGPDTSRQPQNI